jgi:hypothetical protein
MKSIVAVSLLLVSSLAASLRAGPSVRWDQSANGGIVNGSFEADGRIGWMHSTPITGWDYQSSGSFNREIEVDGFDLQWVTDGEYSFEMWNYGSPFVPMHAGDFASISQSIDMTDIQAIEFDAYPSAVPEREVWTGNSVALFLIDGTPYWTANEIGEHLGYHVDVSSLSGLHEIEFRLEMVRDFAGQSNWLFVDNVTTVVPEPMSIALFAMGLVVLCVAGKRQHRTAQQERGELQNGPHGRVPF